MGKRRPSIPAGQFAFSFDPPAPARAEAALAGLDREVSATVALILKEDDRDRYAIAADMSRLLDDEITKPMLDGYASEARETFNIPFVRMLALVQATDRYDLLDRLVRRIGAALLVGDEIRTAEIGNIDRQIQKLKERRRAIESIAPVITAGRDKP